MDKSQKPQKNLKKPQKSPLPSRKKPQTLPQEPKKLPTEKPQKAVNQPLKSDPSSEVFGKADDLTTKDPGNMQDLLKEAQAADNTTQPGKDSAQEGQPAADGAASVAVEAIPVKESFIDVMSNIWFSTLRLGTQYGAKADLSPMTPDQRMRLNRVMQDVSQKYLPPLLLGMQEEMGLAGISVEIVITNIKKPEPPEKDPNGGKQNNSDTGA